MKRILTIFFVTLGVIFFIIILFGVYFFVADPLNFKPLFLNTVSPSEQPETSEIPIDQNSSLSESQEQALESVGIDPATLPSEITDEQKDCFIEVLGVDRIVEIQSGAMPTATEFFQARGCLE